MPRDDDAVGYKKPPKKYQFKKGQSGNPRGRVKGSESFSSAFARLIKWRIRLTVDGRLQRMTLRDALLHQFVARARAASPAHVQLLIQEGLLDAPKQPLVIRFAKGFEKI
jgi:hypothetical protein